MDMNNIKADYWTAAKVYGANGPALNEPTALEVAQLVRRLLYPPRVVGRAELARTLIDRLIEMLEANDG